MCQYALHFLLCSEGSALAAWKRRVESGSFKRELKKGLLILDTCPTM